MKRPSASSPAPIDPLTEFMSHYKKGDPLDVPQAIAEAKKIFTLPLMKMNRIQEPFIRLKNSFGRTPKRRFLELGEKSGKTRANVAECIAHAMGYRCWLPKDDPDFKINVKMPNQGLIGCMTMEHSVPEKIEPEFRKLIPPHCTRPVDWKNNQSGKLSSITLSYDYFGNKCGSTIHIRCYNQLAPTFLGIDYDWEGWDEPPPEDVLMAAERGKVITNAPSWFSMTPLSQAYIYDKFSINAFNIGGSDQEIAVFRGSIWDNCQDWCRQCDVTIPENHPENFPPGQDRPVNRCPQCGEIMGFAPRAGIEEYLKMYTDPEERDQHENGTWAHLSGLIYKELDRAVHIYKDFAIPKQWMKIEVVDPHDARPTRWIFGAVSPEEIVINGLPANRIYWHSYLLADGNIDTIARKVKVKRAEVGYSEPAIVILDAKFGAKTVKTMDDTTSWEEELEKAGIKNIVLSHSDPGDIALGHKRVKEYLKLHYSAVKDKEFPGMMFAEDGCKGEKSPIQCMFNYQWKPGTDKPEEAYKDFADTIRYAALEQPIYHEPPREIDQRFARFLMDEAVKKDKTTYDPIDFGLRMAR